MNGDHKLHHRSVPQTTTTILKTPNNTTSINSFNLKKAYNDNDDNDNDNVTTTTITTKKYWSFSNAYFLQWTVGDVVGVFKYHPVLCFFGSCLLFFMGVEYTLSMISPSSPAFDIGFVATVYLHRVLESSPALNTICAGLNTVFVGMQTTYIIGAFVIEGRPRATVAALFMFTCRGILGYSTQLPLPEGFLGSGVDFPVGNVSFFLFYSGHVAGSVIASLDMRRMQRFELAFLFDTLNLLQVIRLLSTRGHYTIDLAVGVGAGMLFDSLAGKYLKNVVIVKTPNGDGLHKIHPLVF